jgi:hypothetical protein
MLRKLPQRKYLYLQVKRSDVMRPRSVFGAYRVALNEYVEAAREAYRKTKGRRRSNGTSGSGA